VNAAARALRRDVARVKEIDREFHDAPGEEKAGLLEERRALTGRTDVAAALGEQEAARRAEREKVAERAELAARAEAAFTAPKFLGPGEAAVDAKLVALSEGLGDESVHALRDRIDKLRYEPAFAFVVGAAYGAGVLAGRGSKGKAK
jgi:hypothetical protein